MKTMALSFVYRRLFTDISRRKLFRRCSSAFIKDAKIIQSTSWRKFSTTSTINKNVVSIKKDGKTLDIHPTWLRENCRCQQCYTNETFQRSVLFNNFKEQPGVARQKLDGDNVVIKWKDGHESTYSFNWLRQNLYTDEPSPSLKVLWDKHKIQSSPVKPVPYEGLLHKEKCLADLLRNLYVYGFGLVSNVTPVDEATTRKVAERVCIIQETFFGVMWTFTADLACADTAYTNLALGAHTDSTYLETPTGIQIFHCLYHDGTGGETLLVDGFHCCEQLRAEDPEAFRLLSEKRIHHEYREPGVFVKSLDTVIDVWPNTGEMRKLRYNQYDRSPISTIPQLEVADYYSALGKLASHVTDFQNEHWIKLRPGTVLLIDNWRVMHGRAAFTGKRTVSGCYLPRDDWLSKARCLKVI